MANKRQLKKSVRLICGDVAGECLIARQFMTNADAEKLNQAIVATAELQEEALSRVSVVFDKSPKDFENRQEYNKAKNKYYRTAYHKLIDHFNESVQKIVHLMNEAMPAEQKEANKAAE